MRRRSMPPASAIAASALFLFAIQAAQAMPPRHLRPLWSERSSKSAAGMPAYTPPPASDPLDASWVAMPLPTPFPLNTPGNGNLLLRGIEFQGKLIVAGAFNAAGSVPAHSIASWDGSVFGAMGDPGMSAQTLIVWNGLLHAAGHDFLGHALVSRWDGSVWTPVGTATGGHTNGTQITCMEIFNNELVVSGDFSAIDGVPAARVARFDGSQWHAMGAGFTGTFQDVPVFDLQAVGGDLYAAGSVLGGIAGGVERWDGNNWVGVGSGLNGNVSAMATDGTSLYAAGSFSKAGPDSVPGVARWNGSQWLRVGVGTVPGVSSIAWWNGQLVAGVSDGASRVSRFDGTNWSGLGGPWTGTATPTSLVTVGTQLIGLGVMIPAAVGDASIGATFNGSAWSPVRELWAPNMQGLSGEADAATVWNDRLVPVGVFSGGASGGAMLRSTFEAMWDGTSWSTFGTGVGAGPQAICATPWGSNLAVGGWTSHGPDRGVSYWNGTAWQLPGASLIPFVWSLVDHLGDLYAGGDFENTISPFIPVNHIARWNGTAWSALGSGLAGALPLDPNCYSLASWNGLLVAGGEFDHAGGVPASFIASWNGTTWSALGAGLDDECLALTVWNGNLVAGGPFAHAGGISAPGAALWDGAAWHAMGDEAIDVFDFAQIAGSLYAVGDFHRPDGSSANAVARWNGTGWQLLGSGARSGTLFWVEGYHGDLYAGGDVACAFGQATAGIIRLPAANTVSVGDGPAVASVALTASPNPGRASTTFSFAVPNVGRARLAVYDAAGREVALLLDGDVLAGRHEVRWSAPARPGVYFARLDAPGGQHRIARVARLD